MSDTRVASSPGARAVRTAPDADPHGGLTAVGQGRADPVWLSSADAGRAPGQQVVLPQGAPRDEAACHRPHGVDDLEASVRFYRDGLGLPTAGIVGQELEHGAVAFMDRQPGLRLALWPRSSLAHDSGLPVGARSATEFTIGHNVPSMTEVDAVTGQTTGVGAVIVRPTPDALTPGSDSASS